VSRVGWATRAGGVQLGILVWSVTPAYVGAHSRKINLFIAGGLVSRYAQIALGMATPRTPTKCALSVSGVGGGAQAALRVWTTAGVL
jgi:hypothetical protein